MKKPSRKLATVLIGSDNKEFITREGTWDAAIANHVYALNEYQIGSFLENDIIMDVGGHIGSFSQLAHERGSNRVHCYEINPFNQYMCDQNLEHPIVLHHFGLWRNDVVVETEKYGWLPDGENTGGGGIVPNGDMTVMLRSFDSELLQLLALYGANRIRFLKLDCEGSEFPILLTSRQLDRVDEIVGEFHTRFVMDGEGVGGKTTFNTDDIVTALKASGFTTVTVEPSDDPDLGYFKATR